MSNRTVFISYRREDAELIEPLTKALEEAGLSVVNAGAGDFKTAISSAALFVGCVSASGSADEEARFAISKLEGFVSQLSADLVSELEAGDVQAPDVTVKGAVARGRHKGKVLAKTKVGIVTGDKRAVVIGLEIGKSRGKAS